MTDQVLRAQDIDFEEYCRLQELKRLAIVNGVLSPELFLEELEECSISE